MNLKKIHFLFAGITALALSSSQVYAAPSLCGLIADTDGGKIAVLTKKKFVGGGINRLAHCHKIIREIKDKKIDSDEMLTTFNWEEIMQVSCKNSGELFGTDKNNLCAGKIKKNKYYIVEVTSATNVTYKKINL